MSTMRQMMKQNSSAKLSGKEKAQMLKSMAKEKRKADVGSSQHGGFAQSSKLSSDAMRIKREENPIPVYNGTRPSISSSATASAPAPSSLPSGFFDDAPGIAVAEPVSQPHAATSKQNADVDSGATPAIPSSSSSSSSIPVGFFDNVEDDFAARGLSVRKELAKQDSVMASALTDLLTEVREAEEALPDEDQALGVSSDVAEVEEVAVQHSYKVRLADLLHKSDYTSANCSSTGPGSAAELGQYREALLVPAERGSVTADGGDNESSSSVATGTGAGTPGTGVVENNAAIESVLLQKYSHRPASETSDEEDNDSDDDTDCSDEGEEEEEEVDWTARSFL